MEPRQEMAVDHVTQMGSRMGALVGWGGTKRTVLLSTR